MRAYRRDLYETNYMYFLIKNDKLLKNNETWDKVSKFIKKRFDSELVYNKKYIKTKIKSCKEKVNTTFHKVIRYQKKVLNTYTYWQC